VPGARPAFEVADIFRLHGDAFRVAHAGHLGRSQLRVMGAIEACRTAALGGHVECCVDCRHQRISYNSCLGLNRFAVVTRGKLYCHHLIFLQS